MMLLGTQRINARGHLEIGGVDVTDLAGEFGTPLYIMDEQAIRQRCRDYLTVFRSKYPRVDFSYAGKAFLCKGFCKIIEQEGFGLDVASAGELYTALESGFPPERISLHGHNNLAEELGMARDYRIGHIIIDNDYEIDLLEELTAGLSEPQSVLIRVAPGIDPHTHRRISTGQVDTKFGFHIASCAAMTAIRRVLSIPSLRLKGLHCHVGSQLLDTECHEASVAIMVDLLARVKAEFGLEFEELNIGGGLGIRYHSGQQPPSLEQFADTVTSVLKRELDRAKLKYPVLLQEPGRSIVGEAGTTLYAIGALKQVPGVRTYVSVDGGLSDNPRPAMYDAKYEALVANKANSAASGLVTITGSHCETDILISDISLPDVKPGDLLAVQSTGAYNFSMASNYNRFRRPAVVLVNDGKADLLVERDELSDLVRKDVVPARLR